MAKKANKKARDHREPRAARKPQKAPPQAPQDRIQPQDHPDAVPLPRFPRLRLSSLKSAPPFRLAGGLLKAED